MPVLRQRSFQFGNELMLSGSPGSYLFLNQKFTRVGLETPVDRGADAVVRDALQRGVVDAHGQVGAEFRAQSLAPGKVDLRTEEHGGDAGVVGLDSMKCVAFFGLAGDVELQCDGVIFLQGEEDSRAAPPGQVVGVAIIEVAFGANGVLRVRGGKESPAAEKKPVPTMPSREPLPRARSCP